MNTLREKVQAWRGQEPTEGSLVWKDLQNAEVLLHIRSAAESFEARVDRIADNFDNYPSETPVIDMYLMPIFANEEDARAIEENLRNYLAGYYNCKLVSAELHQDKDPRLRVEISFK